MGAQVTSAPLEEHGLFPRRRLQVITVPEVLERIIRTTNKFCLGCGAELP